MKQSDRPNPLIARSPFLQTRKRKESKQEYQHFDLEHADTHELLSVKLGPMPIHAQDMEVLMKKAFKEKGKKFTDKWIINKAWVKGKKP
jgi:hypothetical protein